ncbi:hypothetical protein JW926_18970 [Candidatus Sumerlaeota bacterium]|nr:hypothetical protein [Candidatus Sumerlaeota bacterium]
MMKSSKPVMADEYLPLIAKYAVYAKEIWHEQAPGGYWGGGVGEKDGNGAVRGTNNVMVGYAILAFAWEQGWLSEDQMKSLTAAGLDKEGLLKYIRANMEHVAAHHVATPKPLDPVWGQSWQSSLWIGTAAVSAMLVWDHLSPDLREAVQNMTAPEADRIAAKPPKDYHPGDTGAEENGWDTHVVAAAIALNQNHPNIDNWWFALRKYAVNTYSLESDKTSDKIVGTDRIGDLVTTANIFDDFTTENHNFCHPGYLKVSGQELGEAWMILAMGDRLFKTDWAKKFEPYALHNIAPVWENVLKYLLLPTGDVIFPNGQDWTFHTGNTSAYLAWIACALQDPLAMLAEKRLVHAPQNRSKVAAPNRIFDDARLEWWWEPLYIKRATSALLIHALRPSPEITSDAVEELERGTWMRLFPKVKVWLYRSPEYFVTASWGRIHISLMTPLGAKFMEHPYLILPTFESVLPDATFAALEQGEINNVKIFALGISDGRKCAVVCLPHSVLYISPAPLRCVGIQNDRLTGDGHAIFSSGSKNFVPALKSMDEFVLAGSWLNIDDSFGNVIEPAGFRYTPAGGFNRRSAAVDRFTPTGEWGAWHQIPNASSRETEEIAQSFRAQFKEGKMEVTLKDGTKGGFYRIRADLGEPVKSRLQLKDIIVSGKATDQHPLPNMLDSQDASFTVFMTDDNKGPTPETPIRIEFPLDTQDMKNPVLQIVPRPNYGPREMEIFLKEGGHWKSLTKTVMKSEPLYLRLSGGDRARLEIMGSYDPQNRNVQIAEIRISDGLPLKKEVKEASIPGTLKSVSVEMIDKK